MLDDFMSLANFETPLAHTTSPDPVDSIPASTKSQVWQDTIRGVEDHKDTKNTAPFPFFSAECYQATALIHN